MLLSLLLACVAPQDSLPGQAPPPNLIWQVEPPAERPLAGGSAHLADGTLVRAGVNEGSSVMQARIDPVAGIAWEPFGAATQVLPLFILQADGDADGIDDLLVLGDDPQHTLQVIDRTTGALLRELVTEAPILSRDGRFTTIQADADALPELLVVDGASATVLDDDGTLLASAPLHVDQLGGPTLVDLRADGAPEVIDADGTILDGLTLQPLGALAFADPIQEARSLDVDGDGVVDTLIAHGARDWTLLDGATGARSWTTRPRYKLQSPILADLDGDGAPELVFAHRGADLHEPIVVAYDPATGRHHGELRRPQQRRMQAEEFATWDADRDGTDELVVDGYGTAVFDPQRGWGALAPIGTPGRISSQIADLDGDGSAEIFSIQPDSGVLPRDWTLRDGDTGDIVRSGNLLLEVGYDARFVTTADLDGDGDSEVVVLDQAHGLTAWEDAPTGRPLWTLPFVTGEASLRHGDVDGDGRAELLVFDGAYVRLVRNGHLLWMSGPNGSFQQDVGVADLDGDGTGEVVAVFRDAVVVMDGRTGAVRSTFPLASHTRDREFALRGAPGAITLLLGQDDASGYTLTSYALTLTTMRQRSATTNAAAYSGAILEPWAAFVTLNSTELVDLQTGAQATLPVRPLDLLVFPGGDVWTNSRVGLQRWTP